MGKAVLGAFVSLVLLVVVLGAIIWDLHQHSDQMIVEADHLETLIDQQRESYHDTLYHDAD